MVLNYLIEVHAEFLSTIISPAHEEALVTYMIPLPFRFYLCVSLGVVWVCMCEHLRNRYHSEEIRNAAVINFRKLRQV